MKKYILVSEMVILIFLLLALAFAGEISWQNTSDGEISINSVLINNENPQVIYFGSAKGVFKTADAGKTWKNVLSIKGENRWVNFLEFEGNNKNSIYAATGGGLFYTNNQGKNWERIFYGKDNLERNCTTVALLPNLIFLGTNSGLFISQDKGRSWVKAQTQLGHSAIFSISCNLKEPGSIYVASATGLFKTENSGQSWARIFVAFDTEQNENIQEDQEEANEEQPSAVKYAVLDQSSPVNIYLATTRGVYKSQDKGASWTALSDYGLLNKEATFLLFSRNSLYAVTKAGIFLFKEDRWHGVSFSLAAKVKSLSANNDKLYAACDRGLFKSEIIDYSKFKKDNGIQLYLKNEPDINQVQDAAIKYAEVEPEKISRWRKLASRKAWLPQVSVGLDRNTSDYFHWESGSTTKPDDDVLRKGKDTVDWDLKLSWDLGDLIWNDAQTSIDVRSKLMVQLRNDILDEVTKLYFERLRVKMELDNVDLMDKKKRFDKELRLQELTASLDALTGGSFSKFSKTQSSNPTY